MPPSRLRSLLGQQTVSQFCYLCFHWLLYFSMLTCWGTWRCLQGRSHVEAFQWRGLQLHFIWRATLLNQTFLESFDRRTTNSECLEPNTTHETASVFWLLPVQLNRLSPESCQCLHQMCCSSYIWISGRVYCMAVLYINEVTLPLFCDTHLFAVQKCCHWDKKKHLCLFYFCTVWWMCLRE